MLETKVLRGLVSIKSGRNTMARREALQGYLLLTPWLLGFLLFTLGPMIASFLLGFTSYSIASWPRWIGVQNYAEMLFQDTVVWPALGKTFYYAGITVPIGVIGSLLLAMLLNQNLKGTSIYRTLYYLPSLTPGVASVILWTWLLDPHLGLVNFVLWRVFRIEGLMWLNGIRTAIPSLMVIALWGSIGGPRMLIFLAALQGVPQEMYEAVEIDGGGRWAKFWFVTVPFISPAIFFNLVLGVIGALKAFMSAWVATKGGPARATWFFALHIYQHAFIYFNMGYACALAWILFIIILIISLIQIAMSGRWVFYGGETG